MVRSKLLATLKVVVTHEGPTGSTDSDRVKVTTKRLLRRLMVEDEQSDIRVQVLVQSFEYTDNTEALRTKLLDKIKSASQEDLEEYEDLLK